IGKGQNPWKECNTAKMEADSVKLARRQTGGGAVFHDLGNTNFTFMGSEPGYNKSVSTQIVLQALLKLGITGKATGRNDLVVEQNGEEKKFSGSAYRDLKDRGFHHGTLLLNANLSRLADYLNPDPKKLMSKGVRSVRSRVMNLAELVPDIDHKMVCKAIQDEFRSYYGEMVDSKTINTDSQPDLDGFSDTYQRQKDWNWNFGKALDFSHVLEERFQWGGVDVHLDVHRGMIRSAKIFSDSLFPELMEAVASRLTSCRYEPQVLSAEVQRIADENQNHQDELDELAHWLKSAIV
ncbi:MAG: lipoate--protein ligase, partial [Planctomycetota bacterium]